MCGPLSRGRKIRPAFLQNAALHDEFAELGTGAVYLRFDRSERDVEFGGYLLVGGNAASCARGDSRAVCRSGC